MKKLITRMKKYVTHPSKLFKTIIAVLINSVFGRLVSDKAYIKTMWWIKFGSRPHLDLNNPKSFNEKIQWLKLNDRKLIYTTMVDKYEAKKYVAEQMGEDYIIPTYGVWEQFNDIDFSKLPEKFVLKCTHDSGGLVIVRDKKKLDINKARIKIEHSLKRNYYWSGREWPYSNVKPRIIAEAYMEDCASESLRDYKFYCFDGIPKFLYISEGLENHSTARISFLTCDWQFAPYQRSDYKPFDTLPSKPSKFNEMLSIAGKLSTGHPFLRVDLYEINGHVYFSELTFFPCGGFMPFKNPEHDAEIGRMLHLPTEVRD